VHEGGCTVRVREASDGDAAEISEVLRLAFAEFRALYTTAGFEATTPGAEPIRIRMREGKVWVAVQQEKVIGTVAAVSQSSDCYVRGMAVLPECRAHGVGRQLLAVAERFAIENGSRRLRLSTTPFLTGAIRLYESCGFRFVPERGEDLFGTPLITMIKEVGC